jgi:formiminoglutamate deiminase
MTRVWCELALIDGAPHAGVSIDIVDGRFAAVDVGTAPDAATQLSGVTLPGLANAHSHAFHRALRSRTQAGRGSFWTWRDQMYRAAQRLEPDSYHRLARAVFGEMVLAGVTCVGEFHYLHHQPDGTVYADPNEMGRALLAAADDAGLRITLLDTLYLHGGLDAAGYASLSDVQRRFSDGTAGHWVERVGALDAADTHRIAAAIHSVRAVDPASMAAVAQWAAPTGAVVHAHVSEQVVENDACKAHHAVTPTLLLADAGLLSARFSAVHATHLDSHDIELLARVGATVVMCPTTERDLGDGIAPTREFAAAGIDIAVGSDSHAVIDLFEESRAIELDERLRSRERGAHTARGLLAMATAAGHRSLGWEDAGSIAVGQRADLVTVRLDSVRTAGTTAATAVEAMMFAATASDVTDVHIDGRHVVVAGRHARMDVESELDSAIKQVMGDD